MLGEELKSAFITGGSGGIGSEIVRLLRKGDVAVTAVSIETDKLAQLAEETGAECVHLDITDHKAVSDFCASREFDILINCAGALGKMSILHETTPEQAEMLVRVNMIGTLNCLRAITTGMLARNRGHIINFGSTAGSYPISGEPFYAATKAGVEMLTKNMRLDLYGSDIRISEILPGRVASGMHAEMIDGGQKEAWAQFYDDYDCLEPADIASMVHYILSAPAHVDITQVEIMPTRQVFGGAKFHKD